MNNLDVALRVIKAYEREDISYDLTGLLFRTDGEYAPLSIIVICNDLFYWASADGELITADNIDLFEKTLHECWVDESSVDHAEELFVARARGMRPQQPCYRGYSAKEVELFNAAGPPRDRKDEG